MHFNKAFIRFIWFIFSVILFCTFMFKDMFVCGAIMLIVGIVGYSVIDLYFKKKKGR